MQSAARGIGMGGAVMWTVRRAEGQKGGRRRVCAYSAAAAASDEYCTDGCDADLYGSGAVLSGGRGDDPSPGRGISADHGLRTTFQVFATGIVPLIRNNGGASFAMVTMIAGFGMNIVLDYLFVWVLQLGMAGAAWASILGQAVTMVGSFVYVWKEKAAGIGRL